MSCISNVVRRDQYINILTRRHLQPDTLWLFYYKAGKELSRTAPSTVLPEVTLSPEPELIIPLVYSDTLPDNVPARRHLPALT